MTHKRMFNDDAHSMLSALLDTTEDWLVKNGGLSGQSANDRLAYDYIMSFAGFSGGALGYLRGDEYWGAWSFIRYLRSDKRGPRAPRSRDACADQLMDFPTRYFPNFLVILRLTFLEIIPKIETLENLRYNGVVKLAGVYLPGIRDDIRREIRRRGGDPDQFVAHVDDMRRKDAQLSRPLLSFHVDKASGEAD